MTFDVQQIREMNIQLADHGLRFTEDENDPESFLWSTASEPIRVTPRCACGNRMSAGGPVGNCWDCCDKAFEAYNARLPSY